jgi:hypothetical protein
LTLDSDTEAVAAQRVLSLQVEADRLGFVWVFASDKQVAIAVKAFCFGVA